MIPMKRERPLRPADGPVELPAGLFRALLDVAPDALIVTDEHGAIVLANTQVEALFGWTRAELLGQPVEALIPEAAREAHRAHRAGYAAAPRARSMGAGLRLNGRRRDGSELPVDVSLSPLEYDGRRLIIAAVRDVTGRRQAEEALVEGQKRLAEAQEISHVGSWEWNITQNTMQLSDELHRIYGTRPDAAPATYENCVALVHEEDRARVHEAVQRTYRTLEPFEFQHRIVRPSGEVRWLHAYGRVTCDARNQPLRMTGTCQDITDRKRAEQTFSELLEAAPDAMVMVDGAGQIVLANSQAERMFGWDRSELLGKTVEALVPERFQRAHEGHRRGYFSAPRVRAMGTGLDLFGLRSDGSEFPIEVSLSPVTTEYGVVSMAAIRDVTERKRADEARALLAAIVENSEDAIITKTLDGRITSWNRGAERLFGYAAEEMLGRPLEMLIPPEQRHEELSIAERIRDGETLSHYESRRRAKDGRIIDVSLRISPLRNARGVVIGASKIARDITERKQAERELARRAEALARSNAELEQFAYVASHDLQEPLRTVASYTQLIARRQGEQGDPRSAEYAAFITTGVRQMQELIEDLLAYSRVGRRGQTPEPVDLNAVMKAVLANLAAAMADSKGEVAFEPLPTVPGFEAQLTQLLQNLVGNALKYHSEAPPRVRVSCRSAPGGWQISVADNGIGIDAAHFEKIFVIFQRLHSRDRYSGTGIGLALCRKIVNLHGGHIWVDSAGPGKGSTFRFTLPERAPES
jgi:PAS domain S-box-containing protein